MFSERGKFELVAFTETKMKGNGEITLYEVSCNCATMQENERGKEECSSSRGCCFNTLL